MKKSLIILSIFLGILVISTSFFITQTIYNNKANKAITQPDFFWRDLFDVKKAYANHCYPTYDCHNPDGSCGNTVNNCPTACQTCVCDNGNGNWESSVCCGDDGCCNHGEDCCGKDICCASSRDCAQTGGDSWQCCGEGEKSVGKIKTSGDQCESDYNKCCSKEVSSACNGSCGEKCCSDADSGYCCGEDETCCEGDCCWEEEKCCSDGPEGEEKYCCGENQICCHGECCDEGGDCIKAGEYEDGEGMWECCPPGKIGVWNTIITGIGKCKIDYEVCCSKEDMGKMYKACEGGCGKDCVKDKSPNLFLPLEDECKLTGDAKCCDGLEGGGENSSCNLKCGLKCCPGKKDSEGKVVIKAHCCSVEDECCGSSCCSKEYRQTCCTDGPEGNEKYCCGALHKCCHGKCCATDDTCIQTGPNTYECCGTNEIQKRVVVPRTIVEEGKCKTTSYETCCPGNGKKACGDNCNADCCEESGGARCCESGYDCGNNVITDGSACTSTVEKKCCLFYGWEDHNKNKACNFKCDFKCCPGLEDINNPEDSYDAFCCGGDCCEDKCCEPSEECRGELWRTYLPPSYEEYYEEIEYVCRPRGGGGNGGPSSYCRDGNIDPGEECDEPGLPPCPEGEICRDCVCIPPIPPPPPEDCGNGEIDPGEQCGEPGLSPCPDNWICRECVCIPPPETHKICTSGTCVSVSGEGDDECQTNKDCPLPPPPPPFCGDGSCGTGEDEWNCCQDCGALPPVCSDSCTKVSYTCVDNANIPNYESCSPYTCQSGQCTEQCSVACNAECESDSDCGALINGYCDLTTCSCVELCGDGSCGTGEDEWNCCQDCGVPDPGCDDDCTRVSYTCVDNANIPNYESCSPYTCQNSQCTGQCSVACGAECETDENCSEGEICTTDCVCVRDIGVKKSVEPTDFWLKDSGETPDKTTITLKFESGDFDITSILDIVFAIDSSGSMGWNDPNKIRLEGAKNFIDQMNSTNDRAGVVSWDSGIDFSQSLTDNFDLAKQRIDEINSSGGTNLNVGLEESINILDAGARTTSNQAIIFLTDGCGTYTPSGQGGSQADRAADAGYTIYTIGLGGGVNDNILQEIAGVTGGKYYFASDTSVLNSVYQQIAEDLMEITNISVIDVLPEYINEEGAFTKTPDSLAKNSDGTTTIIWNVGSLMPSEIWEASFNISSNECGSLLANVPEVSKVTYIDYQGNVQSAVFPETEIFVNCVTQGNCQNIYISDNNIKVQWADDGIIEDFVIERKIEEGEFEYLTTTDSSPYYDINSEPSSPFNNPQADSKYQYRIYSAGDDIPSGIQITNCVELQAIQDDLGSYYYLANDIDCTYDTQDPAGALYNGGAGFEPIGDEDNPFGGRGLHFGFDGRGHTVTGLYINRPSTKHVGLFGYVKARGSEIIRNVGLINVNITGSSDISWSRTGGLVGDNKYAQIRDCYSTGNVSGGYRVGGLVGSNSGDGIDTGWITDCYSTCSVNGQSVGGLTAANRYGKITNCYSTGNVSGDYTGGLASNNSGQDNNNFWDTETSGQTTSAMASRKTTAEMKQEATFTNWDFDNVWDIRENITYPFLRVMQSAKTTFDCTCHPPVLTTPAVPADCLADWKDSTIEIQWQDNSKYEQGFEVERNINEGAWVFLEELPENSTSYTDTDVSEDNTYNYRIRAFIKANEPSNPDDLYSDWLVCEGRKGCGDGACKEDETVWNCCPDCGVPDPGCDNDCTKYWYICDDTEPTKHIASCNPLKCEGGICTNCETNCGAECETSGDCLEGEICNLEICNCEVSPFPPYVEDMRVEEAYCLCEGLCMVAFQWEYRDGNGDAESQFQIQIDDNSDFSSPEVDRIKDVDDLPDGFINTQAVLAKPEPGDGSLVYDTAYYWRVKVWDSTGMPSEWHYGTSFFKDPHPYPSIEFECQVSGGEEQICEEMLPKAMIGEKIKLIDKSICYSSCDEYGCVEYNCKDTPCAGCDWTNEYTWDFGDETQSNTIGDTTHTYAKAGPYMVNLIIEDDVGSCQKGHTIFIGFKLPGWKEVSPF